jgi:hypothetical protein
MRCLPEEAQANRKSVHVLPATESSMQGSRALGGASGHPTPSVSCFRLQRVCDVPDFPVS